MNVAIDGPAGAGKSTIAKKVAKELGYIYVDTGAMYRAMALYLLRHAVDRNSDEAISKECQGAEISIEYENGVQIVLLNGENVNDFIRTPEVSEMASVSSANADVRVRLVKLQQSLAAKTSVVMDGRDIASKVLPEAEVKIYLTASSACRAKRRYDEMQQKGEECDLEQIEKDIIDRDYRDMHRENSPLVQVPEAVLVDSSDMSIEEVTKEILRLCQNA